MEEYKSVKKYLNQQNKSKDKKKCDFHPIRNRILNFVNRSLLSGILLLSVLCMIKMNPESRQYVYRNLYGKNFSFAPFQEWYQKNLGNLFLEKFSATLGESQAVFQESLVYQKAEQIENGVRLTVGKGYLMPAIESGIVVFMGEKESYGEVLIIQQMNGVDLWYCGLTSTDLKLYDYIEKGSLLGESMGETVDLYFQKEGEFVDYKTYIS